MNRFPATSWTMVRDAGVKAPAALESLCRAYWNPVYSYIRSHGHDSEGARDLTQSFFAAVLENGCIGEARRERGSFRAFLLASIRHFLANEWDKNSTQKRGGGWKAVSLDDESSGADRLGGCAENLTPEIIFDRQYALTVLEAVLCRIEQEYAGRDQGQLFEHLKPYLAGEQDRGGYEALEPVTNMSSGALRVAVYRLRHRYAELLRAEIGETVSGPAEVDGEIRYLLAALGNP